MISNVELLKNHDVGVRPRALMEATIIRSILEQSNKAGYSIDIAEYEGEKTPDDDSVLKACFNLDEINMIFRKDGKRIGWVLLVMGNSGYDLISDYADNQAMNDLLKVPMEVSEKLENGEFSISLN